MPPQVRDGPLRNAFVGDRISNLEAEGDMLQLHTILHPSDFSSRAARAFELACALAEACKARVIVLHVVQPPLSHLGGTTALPASPEEYGLEEARRQLRQVQAPHSTVEIVHRLETGDPATLILEGARTSACDLIVMGTHGRGGLDRLLMGSVAESVVRKAPCPVLTIKSPDAVRRGTIA